MIWTPPIPTLVGRCRHDNVDTLIIRDVGGKRDSNGSKGHMLPAYALGKWDKVNFLVHDSDVPLSHCLRFHTLSGSFLSLFLLGQTFPSFRLTLFL